MIKQAQVKKLQHLLTIRSFTALLLHSLCLLLTFASAQSIANEALTVFKDPQCGCCGAWVKHLNDQGISASAHNSSTMSSIKDHYNVPSAARSCHTAISDNGEYVFEGHIPAKVIQQFLKEKPKGAIGLAVAGMPVGSPGMEMGETVQPYDVLMLMNDGRTVVYAHIQQRQ